MNQQTLEKMHALGLQGMAAEYERQMANPTIGELPFEQRVQTLVEQESTFRENKRLQLLLRKAKLQMAASVEELDYRTPRGIDKAQMLSLTTLEWMRSRANLVITGPTGTGKTWIACALGNEACRRGLSAYFIRLPLLIEDLVAARATTSFTKRLAQLSKLDLLILDDWGVDSLSKRAQNDLFELIDARVGSRSTIITSQIPIQNWHDTMDNKTVADAILDRIVHTSHAIKLSGESLRRKQKKQ